jgi:excisionase family DNA binding protein
MAKTPTKRLFTTGDAARALGVSDRRIRALCTTHDIGLMVTGRLRLLTVADLERLKTIRKPPGRPSLA